jgi:flagellar hook-associated protein 1 FlgK
MAAAGFWSDPMAGLFDSLSFAAGALNAQRVGLDVAGQNMANINTVGYSRRMLMLAEVPATDFFNAGRGVEIVEIRALRDLFVEAQLRGERQGAGRDAAIITHLANLEATLGVPGTALDARLTAFFDAYSTLANDPSSVAARDGVVRQGSELATAFRALNDRLDATQRSIDADLAGTVHEINRLSAQVARLTAEIIKDGPGIETLRDERAVALNRLAELADIRVLSRNDGALDVTLPSGRALTIGANAYALTVAASGSAGLLAVSLEGVDLTTELTGGRVGGLLYTRDTLVPGYRAQIDQLAYDLAAQVNTTHAGGFDANGVAAGDFFVPPGTVAGASAAFAVDAAVLADSSRVAASATGAIGDNGVARDIAALRETRFGAGGTATPAEMWGQFVFHVGSDVALARASEASRANVVRQLETLQAQTSGVSLDEEAANLMRFQRAYEANARFFTTIVDTLDTLMQMVR